MSAAFTTNQTFKHKGFTLIELLVVIGIISLLASLLLPALGRSKNQAKTVICISNLKQMSYAWFQYTMDHEDLLPPNAGYLGWTSPTSQTWVDGWLDNDVVDYYEDNTNVWHLKNSLIGPYIGDVGIWRCPADSSSSRYGSIRLPRVRSYSMNGYLYGDTRGGTDRWRIAYRLSNLVAPDPSQTIVFIDEREDSIQDGYFVIDMDNEPCGILSLPRSAHNTGGALSFGDGHAVRKRWLDPKTNPPLQKHGAIGIEWGGGANRDVLWLRPRTTGLRQ